MQASFADMVMTPPTMPRATELPKAKGPARAKDELLSPGIQRPSAPSEEPAASEGSDTPIAPKAALSPQPTAAKKSDTDAPALVSVVLDSPFQGLLINQLAVAVPESLTAPAAEAITPLAQPTDATATMPDIAEIPAFTAETVLDLPQTVSAFPWIPVPLSPAAQPVEVPAPQTPAGPMPAVDIADPRLSAGRARPAVAGPETPLDVPALQRPAPQPVAQAAPQTTETTPEPAAPARLADTVLPQAQVVAATNRPTVQTPTPTPQSVSVPSAEVTASPASADTGTSADGHPPPAMMPRQPQGEAVEPLSRGMENSYQSAQATAMSGDAAAASAQVTGSAPALASAEHPALAEQVSSAVIAHHREGFQRVTIQLDPPELGSIRLSLHSRGQEIRGLVEVDNAQTMDQLQRETPMLMERLAAGGLHVRQIDLQLTAPATTGGQTAWNFQGNPGGSWQGPADGHPQAPETSSGGQSAAAESFIPQGAATGGGQHVRDDSVNLWI